MGQKPVLTEVESETSVGVRTAAAGVDIRPHGVSATVADSIASRLYEDHLLLRREVSRLHDEIDKLRQEREESQEDAIESDRPAVAIPLRLARWARRRPFVALILLIAIAAAIPAGGRLWSFINSYEDTDDAQVDAHIDPVSTRINGTIERVYVDDNDRVKAGQLLAEIDSRDFQVALEQARANYLQAQAQVKSAIADYDTAQARAQAAIAANSMAQHEADRYRVLSTHGVASAEQAEQV
ncbi:MAG: biotin/lipoyl-binding protein, partial [Candidatus Binatus sp.]